MSGPQYIFLILIAIITWGAFVESSSAPSYRLTLGRFALALAFPLTMAALVVLLPWERWSLPTSHPAASWWLGLLSPALVLLGGIGVQALAVGLVVATVLWVSMAATGRTRNSLSSLAHRILRRRKH